MYGFFLLLFWIIIIIAYELVLMGFGFSGIFEEYICIRVVSSEIDFLEVFCFFWSFFSSIIFLKLGKNLFYWNDKFMSNNLCNPTIFIQSQCPMCFQSDGFSKWLMVLYHLSVWWFFRVMVFQNNRWFFRMLNLYILSKINLNLNNSNQVFLFFFFNKFWQLKIQKNITKNNSYINLTLW